jgi:quercetin dioxygenase-like cupin family protein
VRARNLKDLVHFDEETVRRETLFETDNLWSEVLCFGAKQFIGPMEDPDADAIFTVLAGEGRFNVGRRSKTLRQWGSLLVPAGASVSVFNLRDEPMVVLVVASPPPVTDEDGDGAGAAAGAVGEAWEGPNGTLDVEARAEDLQEHDPGT